MFLVYSAQEIGLFDPTFGSFDISSVVNSQEDENKSSVTTNQFINHLTSVRYYIESGGAIGDLGVRGLGAPLRRPGPPRRRKKGLKILFDKKVF